MPPVKKKQQSIAVFGESGSGKTVLLSSFYGAAQEPGYAKANLFHLIADDAGQGARLHRLYLRMRDAAQPPVQNRFHATNYAFSLKFTHTAAGKVASGRPFNALRLVWHDYPGEWFETDVSSAEEGQRRVETFRSLLGADVALLLVDGQKLADHAGEEERYLRGLLATVRNALLRLRDDLLVDGKRLVEFPRIWMFALSKSDLLPDLDVYGFRDLMIGKAGGDIKTLREVLATMIESEDALSVGEDFSLLSSAKFGQDKIEMTKRVGVDLILPIAAMLPVERHLRWTKQKMAAGKVAEHLIEKISPVAGVVIGGAALLSKKLPAPLGALAGLVASVLSKDVLDDALKLAGDNLKAANTAAMAKDDYLRATLTRFGMDLEAGEQQRQLIRSQR